MPDVPGSNSSRFSYRRGTNPARFRQPRDAGQEEFEVQEIQEDFRSSLAATAGTNLYNFKV